MPRPTRVPAPWYLRRDVAHLHQLGVEPAAQGQGIGNALIAACERWAREQGYRAIGLDTALPAAAPAPALCRRSATPRSATCSGAASAIAPSSWSSRSRTPSPPTLDDSEHRCALVRALWAPHPGARLGRDARRVHRRRGDALPVTAERFEGADTIVRVNAEYPEGWTVAVKAIDALADGRVHALVEASAGRRDLLQQRAPQLPRRADRRGDGALGDRRGAAGLAQRGEPGPGLPRWKRHG